MNLETGNIYGPDDPVPDGVFLKEIDPDFFAELRATRQKDIEEAERRKAQGPKTQRR